MLCKIDHDAEGAIPGFLCRHCHPELNATKEELKIAAAIDKAKARQEAKTQAKRREADRLARELMKPKMLKAREGSAEYKTKMQHAKKLLKLRKELGDKAVDVL